MTSVLAAPTNAKPQPEPAVTQTSTPTFERVLAAFENDTSEQPFDDAHLLVLTRLNRAARDHYAKALDAMLNQEVASSGLDLELVRGAQMLYRRIANALGQAALRLIPRPQLVDEQMRVAELAVQSFTARAEEIKWHSFEHTRPHAGSWRQSNELLRAVETTGLERQTVPHGGNGIDAYAQCMLLDTLNVGILEAAPMELAHRWLAGSARDMRLDPFFDSEAHGYQIDLSRAAGPERITPTSVGTETTRYLAVARFGSVLAAARSQLYAGKLSVGAAPTRAVALHFGAFLDVAERLWSPDWRRANWREEREAATGQSVQVVVGREAVLDALRTDEDGSPLTREIQTWPLKDRSMSGLGARLPLDMESQAPLGTMIAFRWSEDDPWEIGNIVRRIRAAEDSVWVVGVRRLCDEPVAIELGADDEGLMLETESASTDSIYAPINADTGRIDGLIVSPQALGARTDYLLPTRGSAFRIRANRVIDRGEDWVRFGFEVLGKR